MQEIRAEKPLVEAQEGLGAALRHARESRGMSLHKAAQNMHVSDDVIDALEQNDFARLGAPIFVRGHLRNYARLLGLPEDEVLATEHSVDKRSPPPLMPLRPGHNFGTRLATPVFSVIVIGALIVLGIVWWRHHLVNQPAAASVSHVAAAIPQPASVSHMRTAAATGPGTDLKHLTHSLSSQPVPVPAKPSKPVLPPMAKALVHTKATQISVHETGVISATALTQARFTLSQASWIEVYDASGKRLYYNLAPAGDTLTVSGAGPLQVFLGNSPGVSIELNGTPFNQTPYMHPDKTARFSLGGNTGNSGQAG